MRTQTTEKDATPKRARRGAPKAAGRGGKGFTAEERAAMRDRVRELKGGATEGEGAVLAKLAEMAAPDRALGERIHAIVMAAAPSLTPKLWYGMPAWARDGKVLCFFQSAEKFKSRYATFGFSDAARLDDGAMWPTGFAVKDLTADDEERIAALVKRAAG